MDFSTPEDTNSASPSTPQSSQGAQSASMYNQSTLDQPQKRSIRQISRSDRSASAPALKSQLDSSASPYALRSKRSAKKTPLLIGAGALFVALFGFFAFSSMGAGASVQVTPRTEPINLKDDVFSVGNSDSDADFKYEVVTFSKEASKTLTAEGEEFVEDRASGTITISNAFSEESEDIVKNTRFRTPDGKIFRIRENVTIPGMKGATPGTLTVQVWADEAGPSYNVAPTTFVIPGFESNADKFKKITASSKEAMKGGFSGNRKVVSEEDRDQAIEELKEELEKQVASTSPELPKGVIGLSSNAELDYEVLPDVVSGDSVKVTVRATTSVPALSITELASYVASQQIDNYSDEAVTFADLSCVSVKEAEDDDEEDGIMNVMVSASSPLVYIFDEKELKKKLAGASVSELDSIARDMGSIDSISVDLKPFWRRSLPQDVSKITIVTTSERASETR